MIDSHVIEVAGTFAGAAVSAAGGFRFIAVDSRVRDLNGRQWRTLDEVQQAAGCLMRKTIPPYDATRSDAAGC